MNKVSQQHQRVPELVAAKAGARPVRTLLRLPAKRTRRFSAPAPRRAA